MNKRLPKLLIFAGIGLVVLAGILMAYSLAQDYFAGQRAQLVMEQAWGLPSSAPLPVSTPAGASLLEDPDASIEAVPLNLSYTVIGVLSIPQLGVELPVLSECNDDLLKISVCRFGGGQIPEKPERMIVSGHNYRSHFGRLSSLVPGDEVRFTNLEGIEYRYAVSELTDISAGDRESLGQGEWDITLLTCNFDRSKRILVRCRETG